MVKKPRIVGFAFYGLYLLIFLEVASRVLLSIKPILRRVGGRDESSFRLRWVKLHDIGQNFIFKFDMYHPVRGWALTPNIKNMVAFDGKIVNSNSKGIRGKKEYDYHRQPGRQRILILGDSYTFGDEVSDDETYPYYLESLLLDTEVLNLAVHGYGHDQMLLYLREEGVKYQPDLILVGFVWSDVIRNTYQFFGFSKPRFKLQDHQLVLTNVPVPTPQSLLRAEVYRSKLLDLGVMLLEKFRWHLGLNQEKGCEITKAIFDEIVATSRAIGATPVFVYLPILGELTDSSEAMSPSEQFLFNYCKERRVPCAFLRQYFKAEGKRGVSFHIRSHWLAEEHRIGAGGIKEYLVERGLIRVRPVGPSTAGRLLSSMSNRDFLSRR